MIGVLDMSVSAEQDEDHYVSIISYMFLTIGSNPAQYYVLT